MAETFESVAPRRARCSAASRVRPPPTSTARSQGRRLHSTTGGWCPRPSAGNILFRFAELLREHKEELTDLMTREMGKVKAEAGGDVQEAIDMSYYMGGEGRRLLRPDDAERAPRQVHDERAHARRRRRRDHAVELPDRDPGVEALPALVCGNTVVLKPAEDTPLLADRFVELLHEGRRAAGVVNIVHGYGEEAGDALVRIPDVPVITFTARARRHRSSRRPRPTCSSTSTSSSAARTRSSSWTTPTSTSPSRDRLVGVRHERSSAARPRRA
jgi:hypothetical protein